ncbi:hypothetical protein DSM106972_033230 [Dulcicalothrix desertica PCC 7102]|uniref:Uncharacterized protein n=1 Tax=Dulcicalothrix desertica PCC 7102 TaxID=232991 RepID=A0A433VJ45_9CYAN|nr:hypothetical protein [Dulcicalothrix desertica]RUT06117.1 hypothetical protein DSM106972_033230 [Dulcicalothrix desertica PCC 7102]TWH54223.1 hypothetical protein CAL7102_02236 [Dulcicalothrix desertica PCC 7102]
MPSITYNRTDSKQPQNINIKGYVVHPGLHILSHQQMKLLREQILLDDKLESLVNQGIIKLMG